MSPGAGPSFAGCTASLAHRRLASSSSKLVLTASGTRPPLSETKLWAELSAGKLGLAFRRQVPVGHRYIVDFLASSLKLVVELDGSVHATRGARDARRDEWLRRAGYRVVRFRVEDVMRDVDAVVMRLRGIVR